MNYSTRVVLGVKDCHLELDEKHFTEPIEDQGDRIVIHFIQSYPLRCPRCGQPMLKNGFKTVNALGPNRQFGPFKNKSTSVSLLMTVPLRLPASPQSRTLIIVIISPGPLSNGQ